MFPKIPPWFQPYARTLSRAALQIALTSAVINMLALTMPLYMTQVYDRVLSTGSIPTLLGLSLIAAVAFAANAQAALPNHATFRRIITASTTCRKASAFNMPT